MSPGSLSSDVRPAAGEGSGPLRLGLVGCGYQGNCLATAAIRTDVVRLVACADPDPGALARVAGLVPDLSTHPSLEALLEEAEVDAVLVATPNHLLCPLSLVAMGAGKHVLAEKPIGLNQEEGATLEAVAEKAGARFMAGYSMRFSVAGRVHELLSAGLVGEIQAITGHFACGPLDHGWVASPETGGGPLLFLGSHLVDMVLWFAGDDVVDVSGHIRRRAGIEIDETSTFEIRFAGGAVAQCMVAQGLSSFSFTVEIHGRDGRVSLRGHNFLQYEVEVVSKVNSAYAQPTVLRPYVDRDHITMMLVPELEEFAGAIAERRPPSIDATDGRRVLQVLDAVVASDRSGAPVLLS